MSKNFNSKPFGFSSFVNVFGLEPFWLPSSYIL